MTREQGSFSKEEAIKRFEQDLRHRLEVFDAAEREVTIRNAVYKFAGQLYSVQVTPEPSDGQPEA